MQMLHEKDHRNSRFLNQTYREIIPSMKKIVIFYPHIGEYGGIERNVLALAEEIDRKGHRPVLVCYYDHIDMTGLFAKLERVILKDHWNPFLKAMRLRDWLQKNKKDIVGMPLFFGGKAGFYASISQANFFVLHYTDPPSLLYMEPESAGLKSILKIPRKHISDWLTRQGVRRAEIRLTMTRKNAEELRSLYSQPFEVVLQGGLAPSAKVNNSCRCAGPVLRVFSICRITASKNLEWILSTTHYLKSSQIFGKYFKNIEVIIAGTGPHLGYLRKQANDLGIEDCVHFPGFLNPEEVENEYRRSDLFLVPARQGYGLPVLEALYRHVPVVLNVESRISEIFAANPWTAISDNSVDSFKQTALSHILKLRKNYPDPLVLNTLPNEQTWAAEIGQHCRWW